MLVNTPTLTGGPKLVEGQRYVTDQQRDGRIQPWQLDTTNLVCCVLYCKQSGRQANQHEDGV